MVNSPHTKLRSTSSKNGVTTPASAGGSEAEAKSSSTPSSTTSTSIAQVLETFRKSLKASSDWADKDELLDVVYWGRQAIGALIGIAWGALPFYGLLGIGVYLALTTAIVHVYVTVYQRQDEERFGGFWELAKEGFGSAFATFLVCWILIYTAVHFEALSSAT